MLGEHLRVEFDSMLLVQGGLRIPFLMRSS